MMRIIFTVIFVMAAIISYPQVSQPVEVYTRSVMAKFPWKSETARVPLDQGKFGLIVTMMDDALEVDTATAAIFVKKIVSNAIKDSVTSCDFISICYQFWGGAKVVALNFRKNGNKYYLKKP